MGDYDPHDFEPTRERILSAWLTAAIFMLIVAVAATVAAPANPARHNQVASALHHD